MKTIISTLLLIVISQCFVAQSDTWGATPDSVALRLLDLITVEPGNQIDTAAVHELFYPQAKLHVLYPGEEASIESVDLSVFLEMLTDPYYTAGYVEFEISREVESYHGIAHIFQRFGGKDSEGSEESGMNSYQMGFYDDRWWIISMLWTIDQ